MAKELSLFCAILDRSQVLILVSIERDISGVAEVVPAVNSSFDGNAIPDQHAFFSWQ